MKERLDILDGLELLSFKDQSAAYPKHYHETYCISLIQEGTLSENSLIAARGNLLISHPFELHSNAAVSSPKVSFSTFYLSSDVLNFLSPHHNTSFQTKVINEPNLANEFQQLINLLASAPRQKNFHAHFYTQFCQFISDLTSRHGRNETAVIEQSPQWLEEVKQFIAGQLKSKIELGNLAQQQGMSKYQFIRWFKQHVGMTPYEYILLKRIEYGKELISQGSPLVDASLNAGFYDQSHFSKYFKKYVGLSPKMYERSCNILQD